MESYKSKGHQRLIALLLFLLVTFPGYAKSIKLDSLSIGHVWMASQFLPGSGQIINKQYWKVPVFYAGMGSMAYLGWQANGNYHKAYDLYNASLNGGNGNLLLQEQMTQYRMQRNMFYAGAALFYVSSVADALIVHSRDTHSSTTATALSMLFPGLGQVYNRKLWKVPVVMGGIASLGYVIDFNQRGYKKFGDAYRQYPNDEYNGRRSKEELKYLRDAYRRNRDLSIIGLAGFYILNIIDANVDAHFFDWDISDNLALKLEPTIDGMGSLLGTSTAFTPTLGLRLSYDF